MKTAIEELIDYIEEWQPKNKFTDPIWHKAKSLLETEKQQIIDAQNYSQRGVDGEIYYNMVYSDTTNKETLK